MDDNPKIKTYKIDKAKVLHYKSPFYPFLVLSVSIFLAEVLVMFVLSLFIHSINVFEMLVDSAMLIIIISPVLYFWVLRPAVTYTAYHKQMETVQFYNNLLEISNRHTEMLLLFEECMREIQRFINCRAIGIRVLDNKGNIPYQSYVGFPQNFYELENILSIKSDNCMCVDVIKGDYNPKLSFYTEKGSFYMNATTRFLTTVSEEEKGQTRNACNQFGYESVALIPIRVKGKIIGLIHIADTKENIVPIEKVLMLEAAAEQIGISIQRIDTEKATREAELKYRTLFEQLPDGVLLFDPETVITTRLTVGQ